MLLDGGRATAKRESVEQAGSLSIAIELTEPIGDFGETVPLPSTSSKPLGIAKVNECNGDVTPAIGKNPRIAPRSGV